MTDRYAFSTGALYPLESDHALTLLKEAGFSHAELMPQAFGDIGDKATLRFEKTGIHISSIHYPLAMFAMLYSAHPTMSAEGRQLSKDIVTMSKRMNTEYIVIHPTNAYPKEQKDMLEKPILDNIRYLVDLCDQADIQVAIENYPTGVGQYPNTLHEYIESLDMPSVKPMVDTTEVCEGGGDPVEFLQMIEPCPCHLHLSDFGNGKKHLPAGEGSIDWLGVSKVLHERNYAGYYTLEPSYRYYLTDIPMKLRSAYEFASRTF